MSNEFQSYEEALVELALSRDELNDLVANGELRAFHEGDEVRFKSDDIQALKKSRETEPTIVLSDTQADSLSSLTDEIPIDLDSLSTDETVLNIEGLLEDETEGTTPIPGEADLGMDIGEDTVLDTEGLDLDDDFDLSDDDTLLADDDDTLISAGPRKVQNVRKRSHAGMTCVALLTMLVLLCPGAIIINLVMGEGVYPDWVDSLSFLNSTVEAVIGLF